MTASVKLHRILNMNRLLLIILLFLLPQISFAENLFDKAVNSDVGEEQSQEFILPYIFIYSVPAPTGDEVKLNDSDTVQINDNINPYKVRYDDGSIARYAYSLDNEDAVELTDIHDKSLKIKLPAAAKPSTLKAEKKYVNNKTVMPQTYVPEEYQIQPVSKNTVEKSGNLKYGALYGADIDTSQLEYSAGLFTRYDWKKFSISTAYKKNQGTAYGLTTDNFYLSPEFKLNDNISISNVFKADTTRNRKTSELVLKIKPFAKEGNDRVDLEIGAGQTYDETNALYKTQFRFNTNIKL